MGYDPGEWADFGLGIVLAGAILSGLAVLALAPHAGALRDSARLAGRAGGTIVLLAIPLVAGLLVLVPGQGRVRLGVELAFVTAISAGLVGWLDARAGRRPPATADPDAGSAPEGRQSAGSSAIVGRFATVATLLLTGASAVSLLVGVGGGLLWLVGASLAGLAGGLAVTWLMLLELG